MGEEVSIFLNPWLLLLPLLVQAVACITLAIICNRPGKEYPIPCRDRMMVMVVLSSPYPFQYITIEPVLVNATLKVIHMIDDPFYIALLSLSILFKENKREMLKQ